MRQILALLLVTLLTILPADSAAKKPFLAVFGYPGFNKLSGWEKIHPDLLRISGDWEDLDSFLREAKIKAKGRPVIVDIDCHGDPDFGLLYLQFKSGKYSYDDAANMGYVVGEVDKYFGKNKKFQLVLEACHSGFCFTHTLHSPITMESPDLHVVSFDKKVKFPVWGISSPKGAEYSPVNWNNMVLLSIWNKHHLFIHDLRDDLGKNIKVDNDKASESLLELAFDALMLI